jgi:hypothetical protein
VSRSAEYRERLRTLHSWDTFLIAESGLPGPRANLELAQAVADLGDEPLFRRYLAFGPAEAPTGAPQEFLAMCGVLGLGRLLAEGHVGPADELRVLAADSRWRIREGVAMALQRLGRADMTALLRLAADWSRRDRYAQRAAAAAICEPALLDDPDAGEAVLQILDSITGSSEAATDRDTYAYGILRRALGYCWSVAAAAAPGAGLPAMERWFDSDDPDVRWIMRENLRKARLERVAPEWVARWREELAPRRW